MRDLGTRSAARNGTALESRIDEVLPTTRSCYTILPKSGTAFQPSVGEILPDPVLHMKLRD